MTKAQAVLELLRDYRKERHNTTASARRVVKSCNTLGLTPAERLEILGFLDYCDPDGKPYDLDIARVW
jgi:hypothetical protein